MSRQTTVGSERKFNEVIEKKFYFGNFSRKINLDMMILCEKCDSNRETKTLLWISRN